MNIRVEESILIAIKRYKNNHFTKNELLKIIENILDIEESHSNQERNK